MSEWDDKLFWGFIKLILNKEVPHFIINIVIYFWETVLTAMVFLWKSRCRSQDKSRCRSQDKSLASVPDLGSDSGSGSLIFGLSFCLVCTYTHDVCLLCTLIVCVPGSGCGILHQLDRPESGSQAARRERDQQQMRVGVCVNLASTNLSCANSQMRSSGRARALASV